jgi:predicted DNA-binding protein (MmcQ/YjbR family)
MAKHEHFSKMEIRQYDLYGLSEDEIMRRTTTALAKYFTEVLYEKMTIEVSKSHQNDTLNVLGKVVIMTTEEYNKLVRPQYPNARVYPNNYHLIDDIPIDMKKVDEKAKEVLDEEIRKSKTAEDYLTNRVRQLQNEHLLPKRRPT